MILDALYTAHAWNFRRRLGARFGYRARHLDYVPQAGPEALKRGDVVLTCGGVKLAGPGVYFRAVMVSNQTARILDGTDRVGYLDIVSTTGRTIGTVYRVNR